MGLRCIAREREFERENLELRVFLFAKGLSGVVLLGGYKLVLQNAIPNESLFKILVLLSFQASPIRIRETKRISAEWLDGIHGEVTGFLCTPHGHKK